MARPATNVTVKGKPITDVIETKLLVYNPGSSGRPFGKTLPADLMIRRDASDGTSAILAESAFHNGVANLVPISYTLPNQRGRAAYTVKVKKGFIYRRVVTTDITGHETETIYASCGDVEISAGGQVKNYVVDDFSPGK